MQLIPGVIAPPQSTDQHELLMLAVVPLDLECPVATTSLVACVEIDSGPPPDNLVVTLQRLVL